MSDQLPGAGASGETRLSLKVLAFAAALACACLFCGAVPWLTVPALGQSLWATGFAQSYANADYLTIYAHDIGFPHPAPIAFGLPATFVQGLLIRWLGLPAIDAYTLTVVFYLALALWGATALARSLGATFGIAITAGLLWMSLPVIGQHVGYSMLALGFALLPFYLHMARNLFRAGGSGAAVTAAIAFCAACVLAIFMDGYTFMMFVLACAVLWLASFWAASIPRRTLMLFVAPVMGTGLLLAYALYSAYVGGEDYAVYPLDFFRGWGVDVAMLLQPTRGVHWIWDVLSLSAVRDQRIYWGDPSVWMTTFVAPLLVTGIAGYIATRQRLDARMLLAMSIVGIYLALGPSLKVHSTKQVPGITEDASGPLMPAQFAVGATGSGVLSMHVPGFRQMRASYRWIGLGEVGLWGLTVLLLVRFRARPMLAFTIAGVLVMLFLPNVPRLLRDGVTNRRKADVIAATFVPGLREVAGEQGRLFFAPYGNDFIASYVVPLAGLTSYNIGGDKNVAMARAHWPQALRELGYSSLGTDVFSDNVRMLLMTGEVDAIVLPYFDMLTTSWIWPVDPRAASTLREQRLPLARAAALAPCFKLREFPLFATVSLSTLGHAERERVAAGDAAHMAAACRLAE